MQTENVYIIRNLNILVNFIPNPIQIPVSTNQHLRPPETRMWTFSVPRGTGGLISSLSLRSEMCPLQKKKKTCTSTCGISGTKWLVVSWDKFLGMSMSPSLSLFDSSCWPKFGGTWLQPCPFFISVYVETPPLKDLSGNLCFSLRLSVRFRCCCEPAHEAAPEMWGWGQWATKGWRWLSCYHVHFSLLCALSEPKVHRKISCFADTRWELCLSQLQ